MRIIARVLPESPTVIVPSGVMGPVELRPGTVWSNDRLLVNAGWGEVYYAIGDRLYVMSTAQFIRSEWLNALSAGGARAAWLIPIAKAEMALLAGLFAPWYLMLGMICAKTAAVYYSHKKVVATAHQHAGRLLAALQKLRHKHPTFFNKVIRRAAWETFTNLPSGITGEDIGFLLGRLLRGVDGAPDLAMATLVKMTIKVTAIVAATHLPSIAAHGIEAAAKAHVDAFHKQLVDAGFDVSRPEAEAIVRDILQQGQGEFRDIMQELQESAKGLGDVMKELEQALRD